jgi:hypothetical protein
VIVEDRPNQRTAGQEAENPADALGKEQSSETDPAVSRRGDHIGSRRAVWLLAILIVLLCASSIASLVVSHRAYESSLKQVAAIEQLAQSIRDTQRSIMSLARMLEQSQPEEEEFEEDGTGGPAPDGSI